IPIPPQINFVESAQETAFARAWIGQFRTLNIPKSSVQLSFSRSSGPGGQRQYSWSKCEQSQTKVMLKCAIDQDWIPLWAKPSL
ncbi:hypothetical protein B0H17DRAFT_869734, partial [Mycena rosella]